MAEKRKQLNVGLNLGDYERLVKAARAERITVTVYARRAILEAMEPAGTVDMAEVPGYLLPLLHFLMFFSRRNDSGRRKV